jgi:hypothetical protein
MFLLISPSPPVPGQRVDLRAGVRFGGAEQHSVLHIVVHVLQVISADDAFFEQPFVYLDGSTGTRTANSLKKLRGPQVFEPLDGRDALVQVMRRL